MKILEIIPQLSSGGAERFVVDLSNQLVEDGHEICLAVLFPLEGLDFYVSQLDKRVRLDTLNKKPGLDISLFGRVAELIRKLKPDVIHTHLRAITYVMPYCLKHSHVPVVHTIHNDAKIEASDRLSQWVRKVLFRKGFATSVTISKESDISFKKFYGERTPSTIILNGSPLFTPRPELAEEIIKLKNQGKTVLVNVARVTPQKNLLALAKAIEGLPDVHVVNIGYNDTPDAREIESLMVSNFTMLGQKGNPRDYMAAADAFILSSAYEGMPITVIECFACGTFPISTPVGGVVNMIDDGRNGLLSKSTAVEDIRGVIERFMRLDENMRNKIKAESRKSFSTYDIKVCAGRYINLFESLLSKTARQF